MTTMRTLVTGVAALAAVTALSGCGNSATKETTSSSMAMTTSAASASTSAQTEAHNHADMMFAHMMIPHHQQAIEMSDIILGKQGIDPRVVELATQIKAAQGPEIQKMQGWLDQWGMAGMPGMGDMPGHGGMHGSGTSAAPMPGMGGMDGMGGMGGMDGMMSPAEMDALKAANGVEATKLYLTGMITHHQGAITMSQDEIKNGQFPDAIALANSIIASQQKEIDTMNEILRSL